MITRFDDEGKAKNIVGHRDMLGRTSGLSESSLPFALAKDVTARLSLHRRFQTTLQNRMDTKVCQNPQITQLR